MNDYDVNAVNLFLLFFFLLLLLLLLLLVVVVVVVAAAAAAAAAVVILDGVQLENIIMLSHKNHQHVMVPFYISGRRENHHALKNDMIQQSPCLV